MFAKFIFTATQQDIHTFVADWVDMLAAKRYKEAYYSVLYSAYQGWTPDFMETIINGYGSPYQEGQFRHEVTAVRDAEGQGDRFNIMWLESDAVTEVEGQERLAEVWYQLPLNNEWSDLTVTFELVRCSDGLYLELGEIHVF